MSCKVVRNSKFRHVFGQSAKKQDCYDNIRITKSSWDSTFCCVNPKFIAIITEAAGGGAFLVLPIEKVGRVDRDVPLVVGHKAAVLDIAWCPHNDNLIASSSEDCTIKVWEIPTGGLTKNLTECVADLVAHQRRVGVVSWHPSAHLVLLTAGSDFKVFIWNVGTAEILAELENHTDMIYSVAWNYNGNSVVTTCKDKSIRVFDSRTGKLKCEGKGHQAVKPMRAIYTKDNRIFTTGFSRTGERQYALWDPEKLDSALVMEELDSSNGVLFPFYDEDTNMIYLCGKGDSAIRYFEYTAEPPYIHYLNTHSSSDPQRGMGYMPKRGLNVGGCEIAKFFKLHNSGLCEVITMTVPRKSELFQEDLYPDTAAEEAAISAEDWFNGKDANPVLMSLKEIFLSGIKDSKPAAGASILRQASRRIGDKTNRDSTVLSNTDSSVNMSRSALASGGSSRAVGNGDNNGGAIQSGPASSEQQQSSNGVSKALLSSVQHNEKPTSTSTAISNGNHTSHTNGSSSSSNGATTTTSASDQATIDKLNHTILALQDELRSLKDLVKKHERRIFKLESEKNNIEVDADSNE